jgi:hypothetical protein
VSPISAAAPATGPPARLAETANAVAAFRVAAGENTPVTQPYWLAEPRRGLLFTWPPGAPAGEPFGPAPLNAIVDVRLAGTAMAIERAVEFRGVDAVRGEVRRRIDVVPAISVEVQEPLLLVPAAKRSAEWEIVAQVVNLTPARAEGVLRLDAPVGWTVTPSEARFQLAGAGERAMQRFAIRVNRSAEPGEYRIAAAAIIGDRMFDRTLQTVAYPHIQTHRLYTPAVTRVRLMDLLVPTVRVGYIAGTGDDVPTAIARMGIPVVNLDAQTLAGGDLSQFDTIVVGIRASEARPDFIANHQRLLQWVEEGGALIVQYQQPDYVERGLPPYPARVGPRVTEENAAVTVLQPTNPAFTTPNRIRVEDWSDWTQERSVNNWTGFDPHYTALLESHDSGDDPQTGAELMARLGRGVYIYTALAWFRQLPAGVPGAYRLFANLLAFGQEHYNRRAGSDPKRSPPAASRPR